MIPGGPGPPPAHRSRPTPPRSPRASAPSCPYVASNDAPPLPRARPRGLPSLTLPVAVAMRGRDGCLGPGNNLAGRRDRRDPLGCRGVLDIVLVSPPLRSSPSCFSPTRVAREWSIGWRYVLVYSVNVSHFRPRPRVPYPVPRSSIALDTEGEGRSGRPPRHSAALALLSACAADRTARYEAKQRQSIPIRQYTCSTDINTVQSRQNKGGNRGDRNRRNGNDSTQKRRRGHRRLFRNVRLDDCRRPARRPRLFGGQRRRKLAEADADHATSPLAQIG